MCSVHEPTELLGYPTPTMSESETQRNTAVTTIRVAPSTADDLHDLKSRGDTYDDVVCRLIEDADTREAEL